MSNRDFLTIVILPFGCCRYKAPTFGKDLLNRFFININSHIACVFALPKIKIPARAKISKKLTLLIVLLCQLSTAWGARQFEYIYAISAGELTPIANQIITERFEDSLLTGEQNYLYLEELQQNLQSLKSQHQNNPIFWFLLGLNHSNLAEVRYINLRKQESQSTIGQDLEISNHNIARSRAYDNAIRLDDSEPRKLSAAIYATMGYGLSNQQKIKTYSRELELGIASENESNEWFLHWAKIDALVHEKKLEEAQLALTVLQTLLARKKQGAENYDGIVKQAKTQVTEASQKVSQRKINKQKKEQTSAKALEQRAKKWTWKTWLLVTIGVFTIGFVLVTAIYYQFRKISYRTLIDD